MKKSPTSTGFGICAWNAVIFSTFAVWLAGFIGVAAMQRWWPTSGWQSVMITAVLVGAIAAPLIYLVAVRPLIRRLNVEEGLTQAPQAALTTIDPLTRILNQRGISSSLLEAMAQSQRYHTPLALALVRVEELDEIRKHHGEAGRKRALQMAAAVISEVVRLPDRVGRNGNDEFVVIMPQTKTPAATKVAERIRSAFAAQRLDVNGAEAKLNIKYGVAAFGKGQDLEGFLANATRALQDGKAGTRRKTSTEH